MTYDDYAPCSGLYVPTSQSQLPAPITWQACEATAGVTGCRRIAVDWASSGQLPTQLYLDADAALDANGNVVVITSREFGHGSLAVDYKYSVIAGADGPVYTSILATQPTQFLPYVFVPPTFTPPRWLLLMYENSSHSTSGYVAGVLSSVAPLVHGRFPGPDTVVTGDLGLLDINSNAFVNLLDFDSGTKVLEIKSPSLPMSFEWMFHASVYWQGNSGAIDDVGRWDPDAGAVDFINFGLDPTHGAMALGTDGTNMVWLEEHGTNPEAGPYAHASEDYWTSPHATTPSSLVPRRLRSEVTPASVGNPITVGCSMAAYATPLGLRVLRLSDGWSWFVPNVTGWRWQQTLAMTCSELFVTVQVSGPITTMARLPWGQLGAGVAPD